MQFLHEVYKHLYIILLHWSVLRAVADFVTRQTPTRRVTSQRIMMRQAHSMHGWHKRTQHPRIYTSVFIAAV
jgi:hypothetical protein